MKEGSFDLNLRRNLVRWNYPYLHGKTVLNLAALHFQGVLGGGEAFEFFCLKFLT